MKHVAIRLVMLVAVCVWATCAGCVKHQTTLPPPVAQPNPQPRVAADVGVRVQTLGRLADTYARLSSQLPGADAAAYRMLLTAIFARLEEILPMLEGPNPDAEFRQQLHVIADAQVELATGPAELSPEPTIDTGLRAARDALTSIGQGDYYEQAGLTPRFDQFSAKINDLDAVRGLMHQVYVDEAVAISSQIISTMADVLGQRLAEQGSSTRPASRPAATAPSSNR